MHPGDTIVALSSGGLPSGVAIIRISGLLVGAVLEEFIGQSQLAPRQLFLKPIKSGDQFLDQGLVAFFPGPHSFTGEDCAELHTHGSPAVVRAVLRATTRLDGVRLAAAGEFTRRAFENGKLDLTEVEGLGDLIAAETETQRIQALGRLSGQLSEKLEGWRSQLIDLRAEIEARMDFSDEGDVDDDLPQSWHQSALHLQREIADALNEIETGRIVREGFRVALAGPPNAGKSSLLNALSKSDLAIVSDEAGTTRDVREVPLDINGQLVIFVDMAGLRTAVSKAETEGVRRAETEIARADLVLWLEAPDVDATTTISSHIGKTWRIGSKADLFASGEGLDFKVSAYSGAGIADLMDAIATKAIPAGDIAAKTLVSRERDRAALSLAAAELSRALETMEQSELTAEALRRAGDALARLLGRVDPEDILDRLFAQFCIGK